METEDNKDSTENDSYVTHKTSKVLELEKMVASYPEYFLCKKDFYFKDNELFSDVKKILLDKMDGRCYNMSAGTAEQGFLLPKNRRNRPVGLLSILLAVLADDQRFEGSWLGFLI